MKFNEDSRVKIPALLHLVRLGYTYIPRKEHHTRHIGTNIFSGIFKESITRINPGIPESEIDKLLGDIFLKLDYDDLGKDFYQLLSSNSGIKLFDYKNPDNNSFHVTTELICKNGDDEFRPDITVLINGMPLAFIEVKKPNNKEGIRAERKRMNTRFKNKKFKRFANITQLMIFSNNMEYEDGVTEPLFGAYYATSAYADLSFNYFREEENLNLTKLMASEKEEVENLVLRDNNIISIKHSDEFQTNKHYNTPTNRIITSLLSRERLAFILRYAIAYVEDETDGILTLEKHIMRYPQLFATKAIEEKLKLGVKKGIIWHTQGSGKTALAYYNVKYLTDYYQKKHIIPKFYFIVDRIDLATQAGIEFGNRGLTVHKVNSRTDFLEDMKSVSAMHNNQGELEISVVNIQKFTETSTVTTDIPYDVNIQRIYFLDEAHRSYNPAGNYLANLINSDKNAIQIALTGTPLLLDVMKEYDSKKLFGDYIHKYYYNRSIADGYTLRLIREGIDTTYKMQMQGILEQLSVKQGEIPSSKVFAHPKFVHPMLDYILKDLKNFRKTENDDSLGAMVVCDTSDQAKELFARFEEIYGIQEVRFSKAADNMQAIYGGKEPEKPLTAALILYDVNSKDDRKQQIKDFKNGKIDILFVYNMLLTGFDAKRLKKLYMARVVKDHNLLQALTRVNRPYKDYQFGYVVDFADITSEFDKANYNYFKELQGQYGDDAEAYRKLFKTEEEIYTEIEGIQETLFRFDTKNAEIFRMQVGEIRDKKQLQMLIKALQSAKELKNIIRLQGYDELMHKLDFYKMNQLLNEAQSQLNKLNLIDSLENETETSNLLNSALEDVIFIFKKVSESELIIADELRAQLKRTREAMLDNFDTHDPAFVSLKDELERIFKKKNLEEINQDDMRENIHLLKSIYDRVTAINRNNNLLKTKYDGDEKFTRIHKRLLESKKTPTKELKIHDALMGVKQDADEEIMYNRNILQTEQYFKDGLLSCVIRHFIDTNKIDIDLKTTKQINNLIAAEYYNEHKGLRI